MRETRAGNGSKLVGNVITLLATAAIVVATLRPAPTNAVEPRWACIVCGTTGVADVLVNVLLYVPYGVGLTLAGMRPLRAVVLVLGTTFAVELLQYRVLVGRDGTLSDVLTNTLGGGLGVLAAVRWRDLVFPTARGGAAFALGVATAWTLVLAVSAYALDLSANIEGAVVWWKPVMPPFRQFQGKLDAVVINGRPTVNREVLAGGMSSAESLSADVRVRVGPAGAPTAPMVWVGHGTREDVVLSRVGDDLVARFKVRGSDWRLVSPTFSLPGAFGPVESGVEPRRVLSRMHGHVVTLAAETPNASATRSVALGPTLGWSLLVPSSLRVGPGYWWLSLSWMAGFLFPLGYWAARGARGAERAAATAVAGALLLAFGSLEAVAVIMTGTQPMWWEWLGAIAAVVAGGVTAVVVWRLQGRWEPHRVVNRHSSAAGARAEHA